MLEIKETMIGDIKSVQQLWADGDVMKFVGLRTVYIKQMKGCKIGFGGLNRTDRL